MEEQELIDELQKGNPKAVSSFIAYYLDDLRIFAYTLTGEAEQSGLLVDRVVTRLFNENLPGAAIPLRKYFFEAIRQEYEKK